MYWEIASLVLIGCWLGILGEVSYHGYQMYKLWLDDIPMTSHKISYDPFLHGRYSNDGMDYFMSLFMIRGLLGFSASIAIAACWPVGVLVLGLIGLAMHSKRIHKLKKGIK